jgi:hypothetical protein
VAAQIAWLGQRAKDVSAQAAAVPRLSSLIEDLRGAAL